jgi:thymidylate synthase
MFIPLYYPDKLQLVNPMGDIGVVTLWSPTKSIHKKLAASGVDLDPASARIAVLGTLYGNGLPELLHNLLYNPQIAHLLILGKDLAGSRQELTGFFAHGLEETRYLGSPMYRIVGSKRTLDGSVTPQDFIARPLSVTDLSQCPESEAPEAIRRYFSQCPPPLPCSGERVKRSLAKPVVQWYPSHPGGHSILRHTPLEAWQELIFRLTRFGHRQQLRKGERIELHNLKVIIQEPAPEEATLLARFGFSLAELQAYQQSILDPAPPAEQPYTYGNRLRAYFRGESGPIDGLEMAIRHLLGRRTGQPARCQRASLSGFPVFSAI